MEQSTTDINILFPVLNERLRLKNGIDRTVAYVRKNLTIPCKITILDNAQTTKHRTSEGSLRKNIPRFPTYVSVSGVSASLSAEESL